MWNFWTFAASILFPVAYAPVRVYWLLFLGGYDELPRKKGA